MLEQGPSPPAGYDKLAALMGAQQELAIVRQYSTLNAKNILYLQAELFHLEDELADREAEDRRSSDADKALFSRSVWHLKQSRGRSGQDQQWQTVLEIRRVLNEYNTAVLQQAEINRLERPEKSSVKLLKDWLEHPDGGNFFPHGRERRMWENDCIDDLVALSTLSSRHGETNWLTQWLNGTALPWCHRHGAHHFVKPTTDKEGNRYWDYNEKLWVAIATAITSVLASLLPTAAIFVLYFIKNTLARLGVILCFSSLFSLALTVLAKARKVETFAATTAFAAVQVVFVGVNGCSSG